MCWARVLRSATMRLPPRVSARARTAAAASPLLVRVLDCETDSALERRRSRNSKDELRYSSSDQIETGNSSYTYEFDRKLFDALTARLRSHVSSGDKAPPTIDVNGGVMHGSLMHQGKMYGAWKSAWFVLQPPYLYQFASDKATTPKKVWYVSFAMSERVTLDEIKSEVGSKYLTALETRACSLHILVYTPSQERTPVRLVVKVLSAPSEETLGEWLSALTKSVATHTPKLLLAEKEEAAEKLRPLLVAQMYAEVDQYEHMMSLLFTLGLGDEPTQMDPRRSPEIAKAGNLRMLKQSADTQTWESYFFVLLHETLYFFSAEPTAASRSANAQSEPPDRARSPAKLAHRNSRTFGNGRSSTNLQDEDAALNFELPWKGCVNVAYATMQLSPPEASNNPCVIQLRTPLRTIYLKAKHELDAEDWLAQLSAAQRGIPLKQRKAKLRKFDVLTDELAVKLEAGSIILAADLLHNPVGLHYAATHCDASGDKLLAPLLSIVLDDDNYRTTTAADQKLARAKALIGKCATLESIAAEVREETKAKIEAVPPVLNDDLFSPFVKFVTSAYEPHVNNFLNSKEFGALRSNLEEKAVIVKHPDETEEVFELSPKTVIGRGVNVSENGGLNLCKDLKVSREHALFAAGKLAVVVRDLGSYRGTHFESGQKILEEVIFPGQTIVVGDTKLTYQLRPPSPSKRKSRSSIFFSKLRPGS